MKKELNCAYVVQTLLFAPVESEEKWLNHVKLFIESAVSHEEPGAGGHSSVEWDVMFDQILSMLGLCPSNYLLLVI